MCRHAKAAIHALKRDTFDIIFLDHDLEGKPADSEDKNSGSEVARFIADRAVVCPCIILHTENRQGRASMENILSEAQAIPYNKLKKVGLRALLKMVIALSTIGGNPSLT